MIIKLFVQRNRTAHNPRLVANLQTNSTIRYILRIEFIFAFLLGCLTSVLVFQPIFPRSLVRDFQSIERPPRISYVPCPCRFPFARLIHTNPISYAPNYY